MQSRTEKLTALWDNFFQSISSIPNINHLPEIKKLMTAEFVVDISSHEIYNQAAFVHELTEKIIALKDENSESYQLWLAMLRARNQMPLKVLHHQKMDGECDFRFSLQRMEGKPSEFNEIQILSSADHTEDLMHAMHELDCLAFGISFGELPIVNNSVLTSLINSKDTLFLIARDKNNQYIGHRWGVMLRDVEINKQQRANIFWSMETVRHPDFHDKHANVGVALRARMFELLQERQDCDFVGYQHRLNHKFHMSIVGSQNNDEFVVCNNEIRDAISSIHYDHDLNLFMRAQFIRSNTCSLPFPAYEVIRPAILRSFWQARRSTFDFTFGALTFFRRNSNQRSHDMLALPMEHRLLEHVSPAKQACDADTLQQLLNRDEVVILKPTDKQEYDFAAIKARLQKFETKHMKNAAVLMLCGAIKNADTPTIAIDNLLRRQDIPRAWLNFIHQQRNSLIKAADINQIESVDRLRKGC